jgi:hypothetical protein
MSILQIVRFRPKADTDPVALEAMNLRMHRENGPLLSGLQRREATRSAEGEWVVVMRWTDLESAKAPAPPATTELTRSFMSMIDMSTLSIGFYALKSE